MRPGTGLVGTPPTAVFVGKLSVFTAAWDGGRAWLVAVAAVNTVASLSYYLRWLVPAFRAEHPPAADAFAPPALRRTLLATIGLAAAAALALGVASGPIYHAVAGTLTR
ncbi:hypothetical protein Daura_21715 [Dactylosporangium aurantiacum]|uniref:NADH-quinone oxidoreductase subunit N n=1 Tax=Dactylosporangium aurantiacum TaxID=35754 RepID=A0A9Q9ITA4_9ACTN|nr:hypothetical protein [Dactylosporangium aurantiacum]MDG6110323.1 hypothetical protein [Dactylosporangium aurantiacum]UWZ58558.1 hypothetical protein Daura_21715 [Dactylosporangium aurantiacum]